MISGRIVGLIVLAAIIGCGPSDGRVVVKGTVTLDGQPLSAASVAFVGGAGGVFATASTDANGQFSLRAAPGENKVAVSKGPAVAAGDGPEPRDETTIKVEDQLMGTAAEVAQAKSNLPASVVDAKYNDPSTSGLVYQIDSNPQSIEIVLLSR